MQKTLFVIFLVSITSVSAQNRKADPVAAYDWIIGRWDCKGMTPDGKVDYTFAQQIERPPKSQWFRFHSIPKTGDIDPQVASDTSFQTFDPKAQLWRYFSFFDSGAYAMGTAPDFVNNRQSWTGNTYENGMQKSWGRILFIKISNDEKREDFYEEHKTGKEVFTGSEVCVKRK
jgi:hypothetical protein